MKIIDFIHQSAKELEAANLSLGHGTTNAFDEAVWLILWSLKLPLDDLDSVQKRLISPADQAQAATLLRARIETRKPAAYLTKEAWLQGIPFYVDERVIVPRSLIAEVLADGSLDEFLSDQTHNTLDLCTGNGSLAVLCAMTYPDLKVQAADISHEALEVAKINIEKHGLQSRIELLQSDGLKNCQGIAGKPYDLILCNPPYVNSQSMQALPAEYRAEPNIALAGGADGMDFIRPLLRDAPKLMSEHAVLVLEIGNEREYFEAAFPQLPVVWLPCSAGEDQVLLVTRQAMLY